MKNLIRILSLTLIFSLFLFSDGALAKKHHKAKVSHAKTSIPALTSNKVSQFAVNQNSQLNAAVAHILAKYDPNVDIGIIVQSMSDGKIIYQQNAARLFKPASSLKIFTAAAALERLGADTVFTTKAISHVKPNANGTLPGDLYFYFDGDPVLHRNDLVNMVARIKQSGVTNIQGNVYIDDSIFDQSSYGPGWMWDEKNFCYAAPTNAIMLDKNCFPFHVTPGTKEDHLAVVKNSPGNQSVQITSLLVTRRAGADDCPMDLRVTDDNKYYLTGCIWPNSQTVSLVVAVKNIRLYAINVLSSIFAEQGIKINGKIKIGKSPTGDNLNVLASHDSPPLRDLVRVMLKKSDNLIADALFKKIGFDYFHKTASWHSSSKAVYAILKSQIGIEAHNTRIVDGSGLSHYNLVSPLTMERLLYAVYHNSNIREPFYQALPNSGIDGSLAYRLSAPDLRGRVHAKTGTMTSISSLAGYVVTKSGKVFGFAIMINDFLGKPPKYRQLEDEICSFLARNM
ncbi:MAG: D-alanyl-D-alanine carboxypeptidase/D-alanyl-D-alanine-endopeptidase [Gammaproteobacteria bacterium]